MGDCMGGEAAAGVSDPLERDVIAIISAASGRLPRGGAAAARWAHNPKVGGSNPSPATNWNRVGRVADAVLCFGFDGAHWNMVSWVVGCASRTASMFVRWLFSGNAERNAESDS